MMDPLAALFLRYRDRADVAALGQVFDRTAPRLLQLAMHLSSRTADAEDLLQATFVLAMQKAETFDRRQPLLPWLSGILAGEARNLLRKHRRRHAEPLPDLCDPEGSPLAAAERSELLAQLRAQVDTLPQEQRQVLLLQLQHGLSPAAIAEVLEVPPGTVRMRIHRGLQALRKLLPAGLAAWLSGVLPQRGLAAVRQEVLRQAQASQVASVAGAATVVGVLLMKKVLIATLLLFTAVLCWWWTSPPSGAAAAPGAAGKQVPAVAAAAAGTVDVAGPAAVAAADLDRRALAMTTGSLHVRVTATADGEVLGVADLPLRLWRGDAALPPLDGSDLVVRTDAGGEAVVACLEAGRWRLQPAAGFDAAPVDADIQAGAEARCELSLVAMAKLCGRVIDSQGSSVANAEIRLAGFSGMAFSVGPHGEDALRTMPMRTAARSRADGTFCCACGASEGKVAACADGYAASCSQLTRAAGSALVLTLAAAAGSLGGTVRDQQGAPVGSVLVAALPTSEWAHRVADGTWLGAPLPELTHSDAAGRFAFAALRPGNTRLWTGSESHMPGFAIAEVEAGAHCEVDLSIGDSVTVAGRIARADGTPVVDVLLSARPTADAAGVFQTTRPRSDGTFLLPSVPLGPFWVTAHRGAVLLVARRSDPTASGRLQMDLELPALPGLHGRIVDAAGVGLAYWRIAAVDADGRGEVVQTSSDVDGRFALLDLRSEHLRLRAIWPNGDLDDPAVRMDEVSAHAGEVLLRVAAGRLPRGRVRGRLVDQTGRPLGGVTVNLHVDHVRTAPQHEVATAADGGFGIDAVPPGRFELLAQAADQPVRHLLQLSLGEAEARDLGEIRLLPQATLRVEFADRGGAPWRAMQPDFELLDASGSRIHADWHRVEGGFTAFVEPGRYRLELDARDLIAAPQSVELQPGERRRIRIEIEVGRSRELVFAGDGSRPIDARDVLHVQVMDATASVVLRQDVRRSPHGDGDWTLKHTFAFGSYRVEARSDSDRRYAGRFEIGEELGDSLRAAIPLLSR